MKKNKYLVNMNAFMTIPVEVEAEDEQEARELAYDELDSVYNDDFDANDMSFEVGDIFLKE